MREAGGDVRAVRRSRTAIHGHQDIFITSAGAAMGLHLASIAVLVFHRARVCVCVCMCVRKRRVLVNPYLGVVSFDGIVVVSWRHKVHEDWTGGGGNVMQGISRGYLKKGGRPGGGRQKVC